MMASMGGRRSPAMERPLLCEGRHGAAITGSEGATLFHRLGIIAFGLGDLDAAVAHFNQNRVAARHPGVAQHLDRQCQAGGIADTRSEEHTSELQSLMRISYAVFCLKKKIINLINLQTQLHPISIRI